ncbi:MAG: uracil-DNA glycosylase [Candidatus Omnitrophica bacterium]|nr:uracil-DNA glycosylase [Candidatus Omnitrophota bacterium]
MSLAEKQNKFEQLKEKICKCQKCALAATRLNVVFGEGSIYSSLLLIGEAPGANEDEAGKPFCGRAGKILDELLAKAGMKRDDVYIANILKCRPPGNRNPKDEEIRACNDNLDQQINLIKPKVIGCLGNFSTKWVMEKFGLGNKVQGISKIHGQVFIASASQDSVKIVPLYHPAVVVYNANTFPALEKDFNMLKNIPR